MFLHLGTSGALGQFTRQLARTVRDLDTIQASFAAAKRGRGTPSLRRIADNVLMLDSFNYWQTRRALLARLAQERPAAVVTLMPHVWTPLLAAPIRSLGARYVSIIHDAAAHPGDRTGMLTPWLLRDAKVADMVITLSRWVADRIVHRGYAPAGRVLSLFHPDLEHSVAHVRRRHCGRPLRLLFFGRILKYKGLHLLIAAVEQLRAEGLEVQLGVAGIGSLAKARDRIAALNAEVINRWIEDEEVGPLLARYDAIALSYVEASQSGVAAMAFGHAIPVIAMPVGGLAEQIVDGRTGILAQQATVAAFADAIRRLATDHALYDSISAHLSATAEERSMARFVGYIVRELDRRF